jgi:hypothetical protein
MGCRRTTTGRARVGGTRWLIGRDMSFLTISERVNQTVDPDPELL